jgi:hypothetical protein
MGPEIKEFRQVEVREIDGVRQGLECLHEGLLIHSSAGFILKGSVSILERRGAPRSRAGCVSKPTAQRQEERP